MAKYQSPYLLSVLMLVATLLSGCGIPGDLYLAEEVEQVPEKNAPVVVSGETDVPPVATTSTDKQK